VQSSQLSGAALGPGHACGAALLGLLRAPFFPVLLIATGRRHGRRARGFICLVWFHHARQDWRKRKREVFPL
jgi:hypothetical protein